MRRCLLALLFLIVIPLVPVRDAVDPITDSDTARVNVFSTPAEYTTVKTYDEHGTLIYHGYNTTYTYTTHLGENNVWNGTAYVPYIWNSSERWVEFAETRMTFYDWYATIENSTHTLIDDMRWVCEYWTETGGGRWLTLDLWDHYFLQPVLNEYAMTFGQRYTDGLSEMNVTYFIYNTDKLKVNIDFFAVNSRRYRFVWQVTGLMESPTFIESGGDIIGAEFNESAPMNIMWGDIDQTEMDVWYNWSAAGKKLETYFGNRTVNAGTSFQVDPSVDPTLAADSDDDYWKTAPTETHYTTASWNYFMYNDPDYYRAQNRFSLSIPQNAYIESANWSVYDTYDLNADLCYVKLMNETNVGSLEDDSTLPPTDPDVDTTHTTSGSTDWEVINVTELVQHQVDKDDWQSAYYIGLYIYENQDYDHAIEDYSRDPHTNHPYMNITYSYRPKNDATPVLINPDDSDNLYAKYRNYTITANVSDADGYQDIWYVFLRLWNDARDTFYWSIKYEEDANAFSEVDASGYIILNTAGCSNISSGNDIDLTFSVAIEWDQPALTNVDIQSAVYDTSNEYDSDYYEVDWDVESRLDGPADSWLNDGSGVPNWGDYDENDSIIASGTISYFGSGGDDYPASDEVDVWVACGNVSGSPWSDLTLGASGGFSMTVDSDETVDAYYSWYNLTVVKEGAGASGTSLLHDVHQWVYLADRIRVVALGSGDQRVGVGSTVTWSCTLHYDSPETDVTDGSVAIEGESASHSVLGVWNAWNIQRDAVTGILVDEVTASGNTPGITKVNMGGNSFTQIWDNVNLSLSTNYDWTLVNHNLTLSASGVFDYDRTAWSGSITWTNQFPTNDTVGNHTLDESSVTSITDPTYGVTVWSVENATWAVWDNITDSPTSGAEVTEFAKLFWIYFTQLKWQFNNSPIGAGWVCENIRNGTVVNTATTLADSYLNPLKQEVPVPVAWNGIYYTNNATKTTAQDTFEIQWYRERMNLVAGVGSDWSYIYTYNQAGDYVDWENFVIYVNGEELAANVFYDDVSGSYEIAIYDIFGDEIYNQTLAFDRTYRITLAIHSFQLVSELLEEIWVRLTSSGGGYREVWLYREVPYEWWLYESKSYQWYWNIETPGYGQPIGPHYYPTDGSWYSPDSAIMYVMTGYGMGELRDDIPDQMGGGGGISIDEANLLADAVMDDVMSLLNPLEGGPVGVLILAAFIALAYMNYMLPVRIARRAARRKPEEVDEDRRAVRPKKKAKEYKSKDRSKRRS